MDEYEIVPEVNLRFFWKRPARSVNEGLHRRRIEYEYKVFAQDFEEEIKKRLSVNSHNVRTWNGPTHEGGKG